ncbi:hypothetical protein HanRHA438_Chr01g0043991 [Helianthus annuus]|nr:hypothetical protein HanRHA438_Chr01g0043991 [Helianthus annuus]
MWRSSQHVGIVGHYVKRGVIELNKKNIKKCYWPMKILKTLKKARSGKFF